MNGAREYMGNSGRMQEEEAGASDNRLSWSPSEFKETEDWEDGKEYTVTVRIRQTAPGEAVVLDLKSAQEPEGDEGGGAEPPAPETGGNAEASDATGGGPEYDNPAIAKMMARSRAA